MSGGVRAEQLFGTPDLSDQAAAATALEYFFNTVGGHIHLLDPEHLVEAGSSRFGAVRHGLAATTRAWGRPRASTS